MEFVDFLLATLAVVIGSVVQATTGVGGSFIIVPLLAWIDVGLVPAPVIFASLSLSTLMMIQGWRSVDWQRLPPALIGLVPGSIAGAWLLTLISADRLGIVFGGVILLAIAITVIAPRVRFGTAADFVIGLISGVTGTTSGIAAPVLALAYQHETGPRIRATLAALYTGGSLILLAILFVFGQFTRPDVYAGLSLVPGFVAGLFIANRFAPQINQRGVRIAVLVASGTAAGLLILEHL